MIAYSIPKYFSEVFRNGMNFFFEKSSLHNAGLCIQLEHGGASCISPKQGPLAFTVVDVSGIYFIAFTSAIVNKENHLLGIHQVVIDFCNCHINGIVPHHIQIL